MNKKKNNTILSSLLKGDFISDKKNQRQFPFLIFIIILLMINIRTSFHAEKLIMKSNSLEKQVYDLRLVYITTKSDLMKFYRRSKIEDLVKEIGLESSKNPPIIITHE